MEKTCCEHFRRVESSVPIIAHGQFRRGECTINASSILTRLIQEAGRWCKYHASDLFIEWETVNRKMETGTLESGSYLFGFRESGVDCDVYIFSKYKDNWVNASHEYRSIWKLEVEVTGQDGQDNGDVKFALYEVSRT